MHSCHRVAGVRQQAAFEISTGAMGVLREGAGCKPTCDGGRQGLRGGQLAGRGNGAAIARLHQEVRPGAAHHRPAVAAHHLREGR